MAQRPQGSQSKEMTADGYVIEKPLVVYALVVNYNGATAGDQIALRDGGPTGTVKARVTIPKVQASGTQIGTLPIKYGRYGKQFATSIYYTEQCAAAGTIKTDVTFG